MPSTGNMAQRGHKERLSRKHPSKQLGKQLPVCHELESDYSNEEAVASGPPPIKVPASVHKDQTPAAIAALHKIPELQGEEATTPTPKNLRQRLGRSWLGQMPSPRLPPVDTGLYRTPTSMNAKMQGAFKEVLPSDAILAASHMHGVREAYPHKSPRKAGTLRFDELPPLTPGRKRATAAYTDRLQPGSPRFRKAFDAPTTGWRDSQRGFAVVSSLQTLAISLSRLSSKPSICKILENEEELVRFGGHSSPSGVYSYARQLKRSALAYGRPALKPNEKPGNSGCQSPKAVLDVDLTDSDFRQSEEKPHTKLIHVIRRQVYETISKEQVACPVVVRFSGPAARQEHNEWHDDAQTIQIEVQIDLAAERESCPSSADTVAASLRSSPETHDDSLEPSEHSAIHEPQESPSSTRRNSAEAHELVMQVVEGLVGLQP
ncbi:HCN2 [Symbiodinium sp. CCMP2592]|nr:HCN2 [Symbiodinium sp. CCMP2592]